MLNKLNLPAPGEDCFRRGMTDGMRLESPAAICFVSESAKRNKK